VRIYIETYGCTVNRADSQLIRELLEAKGHIIVDSIKDAQVLIINTCIVRKDTEDKMVRRITELRRLALAHGKKLIVAGCMSRAQPYVIVKNAPEASLITPQNIHRIVDIVECKGRMVLIDGAFRPTHLLPKSYNGLIASIPIAEGCLGSCSYCIVRLARGPLRSYPPNLIIDVVKESVSRGVKEIQLTAQDVAAYGRDVGLKLPDLLREILGINGDFMIRIGMMNPNLLLDIIDDMIDIYRDEKVYKFLHIPVQSGDNRLLKIMNRRYTIEEFEYIVKEFRSKIPEIMIATDIIVGHPGEDEEAFKNTVELVERLKFDRVHVAHYSIRPHTPSASMKQVPSKVRKRRVLELMRVVEKVCLEKHKRFVGSNVKVLFIERPRNGTIVGRTMSYHPVVVPENLKVLGKWGLVRVLDATFYDLRGEILKVYS